MSQAYSQKICILGGGAIGVGIGKTCEEAGFPFDIIEAQDDFGGLWYFGSPNGHVYKSTHLISSKMNTQFSDYPMPENYSNYPNHKLFLQYLRDLAKSFNLYEKTLFNTKVEKAEPVDKGWMILLSNGEERVYKDLIVANGRLNQPRYPKYASSFKGESLHSAFYTNPEIFKDKKVLIIGAGNSGCDIAVDAIPFAKKVFHSIHRGYHFMPKFIEGLPTQDWLMKIGQGFSSTVELWGFVKEKFRSAGFDGVDFGLPKPDHEIYEAHPIMNSLLLYYVGHGDIHVKPEIEEVYGNKFLFIDKTQEEIDFVLYCTGYQVDFPFFKETPLNLDESLDDLFIFLFHRQYNNLFFAGFLNTASGLGNLANSAGRLLQTYFKAREKNSTEYQKFIQLKQGPNPDLGQSQFYRSHRHKHEVDLWKYIKTVNYLTNVLSN